MVRLNSHTDEKSSIQIQLNSSVTTQRAVEIERGDVRPGDQHQPSLAQWGPQCTWGQPVLMVLLLPRMPQLCLNSQMDTHSFLINMTCMPSLGASNSFTKRCPQIGSQSIMQDHNQIFPIRKAVVVHEHHARGDGQGGCETVITQLGTSPKVPRRPGALG